MKKLILGLVLFVSTHAHAIGFEDVSQAEFKDIIGEFGAEFVHTSVSPASSLGKVFGFEVGVIAGTSETEVIKKIAKELDSNSKSDSLPHAGFLAAVTFPFGITAELNFLPEISNSDLDLSTGSFGLKWTITDVFPLPVDLSVKLHSGGSKIKWNQAVSTVAANVNYEQTVSGVLFQVSKKLTIVEPYVGFGSVTATGKLDSSSGSVFDSAYSTSSSAEEKASGTQVMLGANVNLLFIKLGLEVGKAFDMTTSSLKASLYF